MDRDGEPLTVTCRRAGDGWACEVVVGDDAAATRHDVTVSQAELRRFAAEGSDPTALVTASLRFLLAREPRGSILRRFELGTIERYFPEYPAQIRRGS